MPRKKRTVATAKLPTAPRRRARPVKPKVEVTRSAWHMFQWVRKHQKAGRLVGFVPTMGALHEGHAALIRRAAEKCDVTVVSIFVNPTQFGPNEDFSRYPRTWEADKLLVGQSGGTAIFYPEANEMYPADYSTRVDVGEIGRVLCGKYRDGHFNAVAAVVAKLLNIVPADQAFFGEKDFQQLVVIRRMARDLDFQTRIIGYPTVREPDGLAMSSRNTYLTPGERREAPALYAALKFGEKLIREDGEKNGKAAARAVRDYLERHAPAGEIQYVECVDPDTLLPFDKIDRPALIALAVYFGKTRLIDNIVCRPRRGEP